MPLRARPSKYCDMCGARIDQGLICRPCTEDPKVFDRWQRKRRINDERTVAVKASVSGG